MKKPKVSVLMSVYNETTSQIMGAVNSILGQTLSELELIIVNDNPSDDNIKRFLEDFVKKDKRIVLINNNENIGLAKSMNEAAKCARADILARMDADDISYPNRLMLQYEQIMQDEVDLSCTRYEIFEDRTNKIVKESDYFSIGDLREKLAFKVIIHHPTVMMRKNIFTTVGGYRDFPCAQDYDLWLRMQQFGAKIKMVDDILLKYRVRKGSVTSTKKVRQKLTQEYARRLYIQRFIRRDGRDGYTKEDYNNYILKYAKNEKKQGLIVQECDEYMSAKKSPFRKIVVFLKSSFYRHIFFVLFFQKIKIRILRGY